MFLPEKEVFDRLNSPVNLLNDFNNTNNTEDTGGKSVENPTIIHPDTENKGELNAPLPSLNNLDEKSDEDLECAEISDKDASKLLERSLNPNNKLGRPKGSKDKSTQTRADIGMLGTIMGTGKAAQALSLSSGQTALNRLGLTTHGKSKDLDLSTEVKVRLGKIQDVASRKLLSTLELINEEEVEALSVEKQTRVGMDLARILEKAMPKEEEARDITQFIIVKPEVRPETDYEVIDV